MSFKVTYIPLLEEHFTPVLSALFLVSSTPHILSCEKRCVDHNAHSMQERRDANGQIEY
jgi:hypothetical protein